MSGRETDAADWMRSIMEHLRLDEMDSYTQNILPEKVTFSSLVEEVCEEGLQALDGHKVLQWISDSFFYELSVSKDLFLQLFLFVAVFAVLREILDTRENYVSHTGFFLIYGTMMGTLLQNFALMSDVANDTVQRVMEYLGLLGPAYATTLFVSGNSASAAAFYEFEFLMMTLIGWAMKTCFVPGIHIILLLRFLDQLFEEQRLSKLAELLEQGIHLLLKSGMALVVGLNCVQSLITPAKDRLSESMVVQSLSAVPGVGSVIGSAGDILLSCGLLIKNSVGVIAVVVLLLIGVMPVVKVFAFCVIYRTLAALLQPVGDQRLVNCIYDTARAGSLYLKILVDVFIYFFLSIAMATASTSFIF